MADKKSKKSGPAQPPRKKAKTDDGGGDSGTRTALHDDLKAKFKVDLPDDFYQLWDFCKTLDATNPAGALDDALGLELVGPYDLLADKVVTEGAQDADFLLHWRYFYDPPEFLTVIKGDDETQHHIGYFRDEPNKKPVFVASNHAQKNHTISPQGDNLFAAVKLHLNKVLKQTKDKKKKEGLNKLSVKLEQQAKEGGYSLEERPASFKGRRKKMVTPTFHGAGIVVPLDSNEVGYRELPETDGDLKKMLKKVVEAKDDDERMTHFGDLQEIITLVQFANDECDYGMGYELGIDLFCYGSHFFHKVIRNLLPLAYQLLGRDDFGTVIEAHLDDRRKTDLARLRQK
ncbi:histone PARylation factor 1-like isoform X2 [Branchiostoma floridae]|uniref:Histone PARylation factor 1-like isoform X2 n=1 Tax=Branchiostoma floridae TaxID=7739 RepID=A0A9J7LGC7_BRAFL|nr:histone PARylation factor 1-like isoform X2 [Branchiostoma floridae]